MGRKQNEAAEAVGREACAEVDRSELPDNYASRTRPRVPRRGASATSRRAALSLRHETYRRQREGVTTAILSEALLLSGRSPTAAELLIESLSVVSRGATTSTSISPARHQDRLGLPCCKPIPPSHARQSSRTVRHGTIRLCADAAEAALGISAGSPE